MPMTSNKFIAKLIAAVVFTACLLSTEGIAQLVVRKGAAEANPTIFVSLQAPETFASRFLRVLEFADWFTVSRNAESAVYRLDAVYRPGAPQTLEMRVAGGAGQPGAFTETVASQSGGDDLIFRAVDRLILRLGGRLGPCNSKIAFVMGQGLRQEIFACNFDGTGMRQLSNNGTISTEPSWGANGRLLAYTLYFTDRTAIVLVDNVGQRQRRLTSYRGLNSSPALSPDGRSIAVALSREGTVDLYLLENQNGQPRQRLTQGFPVESSPCWSPRGDRICFVSDRDGVPQLFIRNLGDNAERKIGGLGGECVSPDWSPVENRLAFATRRDGRYVVAELDLDKPGDGPRVLTPGPGNWEAPAWGPDGRHLVCTRRLGRDSEIVIVDSWYGRVLPLTKPGSFALPAWTRID